MSQTILIENNDDLKKLFSLSLDTFVGAEVIHQKDAEDAIGLLKILPHVSLIITRAKIGLEETAQKIHKYIIEEALPISMIVIGECPDLQETVHVISDPVNLDVLIHQAIEQLGLFNESKDDYVPVGIHYFHEIEKAPCDVFIRIKSGHGHRFIKRIHAFDSFDRWNIDRYEEQGLTEFYISKDDLHSLQYFVKKELINKLNRHDLSAQELIQVTANAHQIVRETVANFGLDKNAIELSEASIKTMVTSMIYSPDVAGDLKFILAARINYVYQLCHLKTLMCHFVLSRQSWYKLKHLETVCFVAFFNDITLTEEELIRFRVVTKINTDHCSPEEMNQLLKRPKKTLKIIEKHPMADSIAKVIITQALGSIDGKEWVENPSEDLHVFSKVFIVADDFVKILLNPTQPNTKKDILPLLFNRFTNPSYQKIIKTLEQKFQ